MSRCQQYSDASGASAQPKCRCEGVGKVLEQAGSGWYHVWSLVTSGMMFDDEIVFLYKDVLLTCLNRVEHPYPTKIEQMNIKKTNNSQHFNITNPHSSVFQLETICNHIVHKRIGASCSLQLPAVDPWGRLHSPYRGLSAPKKLETGHWFPAADL